MYRSLVFFILVSCGSETPEPCEVQETPNGAAIVCPGSRVEVYNGTDGQDGVDGEDAEPLAVRRMFVCDYAIDSWWVETKYEVLSGKRPVFYDVGTFWLVTCGADVLFHNEGYPAEWATYNEAAILETAPIACWAAGITATLDIDEATVDYTFDESPGNHFRLACDCHGDC